MKKFCLITVVAAVLTLLVGCQTMSSMGLGMTGSSHSSDSSLSASVKAAFDNNSQLAGLPIRIDAHGGNVQLSGYVKTIRQSDVAADLASKVNGVRVVENNLIVRK